MLATAQLAFVDDRDIGPVLGTEFKGDALERRRAAAPPPRRRLRRSRA